MGMVDVVEAQGGTVLLGLEWGGKTSGYPMGVIPETHAKSPGRMCPIRLKGLQENEKKRGCWGLRGGGCFRIWNRVMSESRSTTEYTYHNTASQLAGRHQWSRRSRVPLG